jgi:hypothetical protein
VNDDADRLARVGVRPGNAKDEAQGEKSVKRKGREGTQRRDDEKKSQGHLEGT